MKKNNDEKKQSLLFIGTFFIFAFFIIFSHKAQASNGNYFPMNQDDNDIVPQVVTSYMDYVFNSEDNYILAQLYQNDSTYLRFNVYVFSKESNGTICGELNNNGYQFSFYQLGTLASPVNVSRYYNSLTFNKNSGALTTANPNGNFFTKTTNIDSSLYNSSCAYVSNFIVYTSNNEETREIVLKYGQDSNDNPLDLGVAIIPPPAIAPDYPAGTTPPTQVPPVYNSTDYTWTTPPTFDGSTVENAIGSLQNLVGWLSNNLKEEFKNLTSNLKGFFEYIGKTIQYYGNSILQTLNNFIQNFYDNMKSLVEPIYTKIESLYNDFLDFADLFINPFDEEEFENQIDNCQLITQYNQLLDNCEVLQQIFDETSEPDSFILYIDFENPFADSEHKIIHGEINFNWLVPLRPVYRPFLQVFVLIECFVGGFRILGNIIGGKAK